MAKSPYTEIGYPADTELHPTMGLASPPVPGVASGSRLTAGRPSLSSFPPARPSYSTEAPSGLDQQGATGIRPVAGLQNAAPRPIGLAASAPAPAQAPAPVPAGIQASAPFPGAGNAQPGTTTPATQPPGPTYYDAQGNPIPQTITTGGPPQPHQPFWSQLRSGLEEGLKPPTTGPNPAYTQMQQMDQARQQIWNSANQRLIQASALNEREDEQQLMATMAAHGLVNSGVASKALADLRAGKMANYQQSIGELTTALATGQLNQLNAQQLAQLEADLQNRNNVTLANIYGQYGLKMAQESQPSLLQTAIGAGATVAGAALAAPKAPDRTALDVRPGSNSPLASSYSPDYQKYLDTYSPYGGK